MKTLSVFAFIICSLFISQPISAQTLTKETIKVWGNCGMCKTTIEKAAKSAGATKANWDADTKELQVSYAGNKTSSNAIQQAIAKKGYDTQDLTGDDKAYDKLHSCCKYDRKGEAANSTKKCCDEATCKMDPNGCKDNKACADKGCCKSASLDKNDSKKCCTSADGKMKCGSGMASCKHDHAAADKKCCDEATCKMDPNGCKDNKACADKGCCKSASLDKNDSKKCCASADRKMKCGSGMASCKHDEANSTGAKKCCNEPGCGMDSKACKASESCAGKACCKS